MRQVRYRLFVLSLGLAMTCLTGCLTSSKMDRFVAARYNNELPRPNNKKNPHIIVSSATAAGFTTVSSTKQKTSKVLPLIVYWKYDYRHTCSLNPAIAATDFSNAIHSLANKGLNQKLNGRSLELVIEQAPAAFAIVAKGHIIWLVYAFGWENVFVEPDKKDLVVAYNLLENGTKIKAGKITVRNSLPNMGIGYFQSWKSATEQHLNSYNTNMSAMAKSFVTRLLEEI